MTPTIRRAILDDLDQLAPLFDAYRQFYDQPSDLNRTRQFLSDRLSYNESLLLIAQDEEGAAIGFVKLYPSFSSILAAPMYLLSDLYVAPEASEKVSGLCC